MTPQQAASLGDYLRATRQGLGLSLRGLAACCGVNDATISRIENGAFHSPKPDTLASIARALDLPVDDVLERAGYPARELPALPLYLRTKYSTLPEVVVAEMERYFERLRRDYGLDLDGPEPGEDER
jgi:transcriptional regulator with XRE-family HTH domain